MTVRVIAGRFKRRVLVTPAGLATRPTAARVREAVFSMLGDLEGSKVLDLYAGSGALGIEALSRGAASAVFVESSRQALRCLRQNLRELDLEDRGVLLPLRVESARERLRALGPFQIVFCDPPWPDLARAQELLPTVAGSLAPGGLILLEHPARLTVEAGALQPTLRRSWGDTAITAFADTADPEAGA